MTHTLSAPADAAPAIAPMLQITGLNFFYGESHILRDVDLVVPKGQMVCL
ncbi:MAG: ABC transporter ATP-binding protein, partial [Cyanobacteria bacterium P01_C01_bin.120]